MIVEELIDKLAWCVPTDEVFVSVPGESHREIAQVEPEQLSRTVTIYTEED